MKKILPSVISILAGMLLIAMAYWLDGWTRGLRPSISQQGFDARPHLGWMASAYFVALFLASLLMLWVWFTQRYVQKQPVPALMYVILGALMPVYSLVMTFISMRLNSPSFVVYFPIVPMSLTSFASVFLLCFGLQRLMFKQSAL